MTLRQRLLLTLAPILVLLAALGGAGLVLFDRLGRSVNAILRENYDSVVAMVALNEALERIDSSFTAALLGEEKRARQMYRNNWREFNHQLAVEKANITIYPREQELVTRLEALRNRYKEAGDLFYSTPAAARSGYYQRTLLPLFGEIKEVVQEIRLINQENMEEASAAARETARLSLLGFAIGLALTGALAGLLAWHTARWILRPIQSVTRSANLIGAGNLDVAVPVPSRDELGELADAFNRMSRQLRDYRRSHLAQLLRAQRTSQATIDSFPDPVLVIDPGGRVAMANPTARRALGLPAPAEHPDAEPPGGPPWEPPAPLASALREALLAQRPSLTQTFDQAILLPSGGEERAYLPQFLPIQDPYGHTLGTAVVLTDVTRFRLLDQVKSDLVATVSHELKTPLTSVRLVLHLLLEETVGPLTPKQTELLLDARDNAERLLDLIEHLLALARLEQGRDPLQRRAEPVGELLQAAVEAVAARAEARHLEVAIEVPPVLPPVLADPVRLGHALNNLLDNAITYTPEGGRIILSAGQKRAAGYGFGSGRPGVGIPPEHLPHVFERFFRVPGQSEGQGTGLGLAIVREIVQAHEGRITCTSTLGQGTTFEIALPAAVS